MTRSRLFASAFVAAIVIAGLSRDEATVSAGRSRLGPTVMMFYGGTLTKPIVVSGPDVEAFGDVTRRSTITVAALGARPYLDVAMFWGPLRDPANNGTPLSGLTPQEETQLTTLLGKVRHAAGDFAAEPDPAADPGTYLFDDEPSADLA